MQIGIIEKVNKVEKEGKQPFYTVKLQDGTEMTTFDPKIKEAVPGDTIEFEVTVSGKYTNLKDGYIITRSPSSVAPRASGPNGYPEMSKEDWAEKQRIERASIEAQTAVKAILGLDEAVINWTSVTPAFLKSLAWCEAKIDADMTLPAKPPLITPQKTKITKKEKPAPINPDEVEFDDSPLQSFGELWTRCKNYGISKAEGLKLYEVDSQEMIIDLNEAWKTIFDRKFGKQEEVITKEEIPF